MTTTAADVASRMAGMLGNHPKAQYLRLTREEAEVIAALRTEDDDPRTGEVLRLPPTLGDWGSGPFLDRHRALVVKLLGDDPVLAEVGTDPTKGGYANWADQELAGAVRTIDRSLRTIIKDALWRLDQLHAGTLPTNGAGSTASTARADYAASIARFAALRDGIHWLLAKQARDPEEGSDG